MSGSKEPSEPYSENVDFVNTAFTKGFIGLTKHPSALYLGVLRVFEPYIEVAAIGGFTQFIMSRIISPEIGEEERNGLVEVLGNLIPRYFNASTRERNGSAGSLEATVRYVIDFGGNNVPSALRESVQKVVELINAHSGRQQMVVNWGEQPSFSKTGTPPSPK